MRIDMIMIHDNMTMQYYAGAVKRRGGAKFNSTRVINYHERPVHRRYTARRFAPLNAAMQPQDRPAGLASRARWLPNILYFRPPKILYFREYFP